jgi:hypothetical protein
LCVGEFAGALVGALVEGLIKVGTMLATD